MEVTPHQQKCALRPQLREALGVLDAAERVRAGQAICAALQSSPLLRHARGLLCFLSLPTEPDLRPICRAALSRGTLLCLPAVAADGAISLRRARSLEEGLAPDACGVEAPLASEECSTASVELALIPGLAFDPWGNRLGRGGGHFDRLLSRLPSSAAVVGVAFEAQLIPAVPCEAHDRPVQWLVTESGLRRCVQRACN